MGFLVITRRPQEVIDIAGGAITIRVVSVRGDKVRLAIEAPDSVSVNRREVQQRIDGTPATQLREDD